MIHTSVAAPVMDRIYSGSVRIQEALDLPKADAAAAARIRSDVAAQGDGMTLRLFQRLFDMRSSYDLRNMAQMVYRVLHRQGFNLTATDLTDSSMAKLLNLPGCSILGCNFGPIFRLAADSDPDVLKYDAGKFMPDMEVSFDRRTDKFRLDDRGMVEISKNGKPFEKASLPYVFPYIMSEAGLSGLALHMDYYNPLTALGGMGMSNLLVYSTMVSMHFLMNTGADMGTIFSQGGFVEKFRFDRETGYQEAMQVVSGGHLALFNAPNIFGGMARRLDLSAHHAAIKENMHLVLANRPAENVRRAGINDQWVMQAADPRFENVYWDQFMITGREVAPFIAAANGGTLDFAAVAKAYRDHSMTRFTCCNDYWGNQTQRNVIRSVNDAGGAAFPLGEGGEKAAMALILEAAKYKGLELPILGNEVAGQTKGFITGEVAYDLLDGAPEYGDGFNSLAQSGNYGFARPPLVLAEYQD